MEHTFYMNEALELAKEAFENGEVPVGCIIVDEAGNIIGKGRNRRETNNDATSHAEIEAIRMACMHRKNWRLCGCSIYVTLEPCPMCAGAIINSRLSSLYYGAKEEHSGSCGSVLNLFLEPYGHEPKIIGGILQEECSSILKCFFENKR